MAIMANDQILLVRQTYRGQLVWTLPGGGIEPGETPAEAAVRETKEEVNLDVKVLRLLYQGPRLSGEGMYYCYLGQIISGHARLGHDPELPEAVQVLHEMRWFAVQEMQDHPEVSRVLKGVKPLVC
jgi:8-oxo-dGTP diphosphatase